MSGSRWTTGLGVAVGGIGGALLALLGGGTPSAPAEVRASATNPMTPPVSSAPASLAQASRAGPAEEPVLVASAASSGAEQERVSAPAGATTPSAPFNAPPPMELPTTREALLKAQLYCDKRQDFDECGRAAAALEAGSAGPVDAVQARRFRRIALTHLVTQCEAGSAHACFVMADKYRTGTDLTKSVVRAESLEKRGLDLCRLGRTAVECPSP